MNTNDTVDTGNIIFVPSRSRLSLAIERAGSLQAARQRFADGSRWDRIVREDEALSGATHLLSALLPKHTRIDRGQLGEAVRGGGIVVLLGGDDFYTYCMGSILSSVEADPDGAAVAVLGVNGKPRSSYGALLPFTVEQVVESLRTGAMQMMPTPYLAVSVNDSIRKYSAFPSVSQTVFLERSPADTSWHRITLPDGSEPLVQGGSGIIAALTPGSGPGSWYANAGGEPVPEDAYGILVREPNIAGTRNVIVHEGRTTIYSSNDSDGCIMPDAHKERIIPFPDGAIATLERRVSRALTVTPGPEVKNE